MINLFFPLLMGLVISCAQSVAQTTEDKEHISKEFSLPNSANASVLAIYNINGFIKVEGTSGSKVAFEVDKRMTAKTADVLAAGKKEFKLQFEQKGDTVFAYIIEPFDSRPNRNRERNNHVDYDFTLDFTVKIPKEMNIIVSTINRGDVTVTDVAGALKVSNINGAIKMTNARGKTEARTINGNVDANYPATPPDQSSYYTLNGNINVTYPANLSADLRFKTFQGEFYTDYPETTMLPVEVTKNKEQKGDKTVYKLDKSTAIRIGNGGKVLRFETFNGNVYIKKQS
ncbi:DUF4097 family beta strand repeat-containing protein [Fibrivirga algicola]|uniref:DUF4097 domain-containing protein n=1 Tax=Fibrivirga algicola TaxID=2950420 RepID=A0ABX0QC39_9BACT|nr:hypothetical protein [Fibrivirga algicola]NID09661.1 hypothetical protein [Fibrivirga algicola]